MGIRLPGRNNHTVLFGKLLKQQPSKLLRQLPLFLLPNWKLSGSNHACGVLQSQGLGLMRYAWEWYGMVQRLVWTLFGRQPNEPFGPCIGVESGFAWGQLVRLRQVLPFCVPRQRHTFLPQRLHWLSVGCPELASATLRALKFRRLRLRLPAPREQKALRSSCI